MKITKFSLIILFVLLFNICFSQLDFNSRKKFTKEDTLRGALSAMRSCYDVLFYDLDIKVDIDNKFISGSNTIKFLAINDFQKLQIDLFANMKIDKIEFCNSTNEKFARKLNFTREFNAVFVEFPDTIKKESVRYLKIFYSGNPLSAKNAPWDGGFSWKKDLEGKPWVGVSCQGTGASLWWPCKDHQSDEPNEMLIRITVPPGLMNVSNGRLKQKTILPDGWTKFEWFVSYPINNYNVTLNIANYKSFSDTYFNPAFKDTLTLDYFVLPYNYNKAILQFQQVKLMLACFYNLFGEYPFLRDGFKLVETPYLGMEHQSCIAYGNNYTDGYLGRDLSGTGYIFDYIIIHEAAHEWWGNSITTNDIADMWIHEGFGTYAEALYIECLYGFEAYLLYINSEKFKVVNDYPLIGKYNLNNEGSGDMYPKGALLIHTIRSIIDNDKLFLGILKDIQSSFKYHTLDSRDIEKYISDKSGIDFSDIFDLYLKSTIIPKLILEIEEDPWDLKIAYRFDIGEVNEDEVPFFKMPVKITLKNDAFDFIYPSTNWQKIIIRDMKIADFKVATDLFYIAEKIIIVDNKK